jgi:hypothetical protein
MEDKKYIFFSTFFDKEVLRRTVILLNEKNIDFRLNNKSNSPSGRAPLSTYIEEDLFIGENDFDRAAALLGEVLG